MRATLEAIGVQILDRQLIAFGEAAADLEPAMEEILDLIRDQARRQLDTGGNYRSGGWTPLAPSTVERKAAEGLDPRILRATNDMFRSLTEKGDSASVGVAQADGFIYGSTIPYTRYHQQGRGVPQRPIVEPNEPDKRQMTKIIQRTIIEATR